MSPTGFEPTITGIDRRQTHALGLAATGIGRFLNKFHKVTDRLFLMTPYQLHVVQNDETQNSA